MSICLEKNGIVGVQEWIKFLTHSSRISVMHVVNTPNTNTTDVRML